VQRKTAQLTVVGLFVLPALASALGASLLTPSDGPGYWKSFADVFATGALVSCMFMIALAFSFGLVSVDTRPVRDAYSPAPVAPAPSIAYRMSGSENRAVASFPLQLLCLGAAAFILLLGLAISAA